MLYILYKIIDEKKEIAGIFKNYENAINTMKILQQAYRTELTCCYSDLIE